MDDIKILKATVLTGHGLDLIFLKTNIPSSIIESTLAEQKTVLRCEQACGKGVEWVRTNFNIEPEVQDITPKIKHFS